MIADPFTAAGMEFRDVRSLEGEEKMAAQGMLLRALSHFDSGSVCAQLGIDPLGDVPNIGYAAYLDGTLVGSWYLGQIRLRIIGGGTSGVARFMPGFQELPDEQALMVALVEHTLRNPITFDDGSTLHVEGLEYAFTANAGSSETRLYYSLQMEAAIKANVSLSVSDTVDDDRYFSLVELA